MKEKLFLGILSVFMLALGIPQILYASNINTDNNLIPEEISITIPEGATYENGPYYQTPIKLEEVENIPAFYNARIPSAYDSREFLTPVKDQGSYGTCWAFAAMAAAESSLIFQKKQIDGVEADSGIDLSEYQLARFQYFNVDDPLNNTTGDKTVGVYNRRTLTGREDVSAPNSYLNMGGNLCYATWSMAGWKAGAEESIAPYDSIEETAGILADSIAYDDKVHMQNAYWLPLSQPMVIKSMIMEYGALASSYIHGEDACTYDSDGVCSYYSGMTFEEAATRTGFYGHAMSIVGWDDNYSAENFKESCRPVSDGAWLIRNSWGREWSDNGYFWISYEELTLDTMAIAFDFEDADNYDYNYQYDGSCGMRFMSYDDEISYANVFTVKGEGNQALEAVGIGIASYGVSYQVQIYKNPQKGNPDSGIAMLPEPQTGEFLYPGYYTIELDNLTYLEQGSTFSVVFTVNAGAEIFMDTSYNTDSIRFVNNTALNQSFMFLDKENWCLDLGSPRYRASARIKAYTNQVEHLTTEIVKAEYGKNGSINGYFKGRILTSEPIMAPKEVRLSEFTYEFDVTVKCPKILGVYDAGGKEISIENYDISYSNQESTEPGTYSPILN